MTVLDKIAGIMKNAKILEFELAPPVKGMDTDDVKFK